MPENVSSSEHALFWRPRRIVGAGLTCIAAVAGLIANVGSLTDFMQPSLSGPWLLTINIQQSSLKSYDSFSSARKSGSWQAGPPAPPAEGGESLDRALV